MTLAWIAGRESALEAAVARAAALLRSARLPLIYGLVESTVEAQREAARIAALVGGVVDSAATPGRLASLAAFAGGGLVTTSLGALRQHADLVVFWGSDPDRHHPGFVGRFAPARPGRLRAAVDVGDAQGPGDVEERLALDPAQELGALLTLRAFVRGRRVEKSSAQPLGLPLEALRALAARLTACKYGVVVHDGDPPPARREPERGFALGALARDANRKACVRLLGVRASGNAAGAENVLAWRTGFPAAVSFAHGEPRYGLGDLMGETLLARGDVDAALVVGADPALHLPANALAHLRRIPRVQLAASGSRDAEAEVYIATASLAATAGTLFRMDGVALRHAPSAQDLEADHGLPSEAGVLTQLAAALLRSAVEGSA